MTAPHKAPPAPPAKSTTHSRTQAGQDWSSGPWKYPPQPVKTPWLESNLAMMILATVVFMLTLAMADYVWTVATSPVGVLLE